MLVATRYNFHRRRRAGLMAHQLTPGEAVRFDLPVSGVRGLNSFAYLISARSSEGFVPRAREPQSADDRNLGVSMRFQAVEKR